MNGGLSPTAVPLDIVRGGHCCSYLFLHNIARGGCSLSCFSAFRSTPYFQGRIPSLVFPYSNTDGTLPLILPVAFLARVSSWT